MHALLLPLSGHFDRLVFLVVFVRCSPSIFMITRTSADCRIYFQSYGPCRSLNIFSCLDLVVRRISFQSFGLPCWSRTECFPSKTWSDSLDYLSVFLRTVISRLFLPGSHLKYSHELTHGQKIIHTSTGPMEKWTLLLDPGY